MASIDERIAKLEAKLKQAKAEKQRIEARRRAIEAKRTRAQDTRRKILAGAAVLAAVERGDWSRDALLKLLDTMLTRADDRALFDLPPVPTSAKPQEQPQAAPSQTPIHPAPRPASTDNTPAPPAPAAELRAAQLRDEATQRSRSTGGPWRVYLDVPFEENAAAKAAGALFDPAARRWYIGSEAHLMAVQRWWPKA